MKHFLVGSLALTLVLVASPGSAVAWTSMHNCSNGSPIAWAPGNPNTRWQLSSTYASADLTNTQVDGAINGGFNEWSAPGCTELNVIQGSDSSGNPLDNNNDDDIVGFLENSWPATMGGSSTLAVTIPSWYQEPHCEFIENADMVVNGVDHYWVVGNPSNWNQADLQSVIAHEAGHWMGFDHNNYAGSTLTASYSGGISERTLTCNDSEGVCSVYPASGNACTADRYCDCGVGCNNGYCGGAPTGDDDDDDDATAGDDDDDDDTGGGDITGPCSGSSETFYETEPNDWNNEDDVDWYQAGGGDTSLVGSLTCGNNGQSYTADTDWFVIDFPCTDTARFTLDWKTDSDLDFFVYGSSGDPLAESQTAESQGPIYVEEDASGRLYVAVMCWEGETAAYEFLFDWFPYQGSTAGGDDDDTGSSDDDDDTGSSDDDDDTGSSDDDDDTGSSDDDDDDETLPERRGCSCYDSAEPGTFALRDLSSLDVSLLFSGLLLFSLRRRRNSPLP